LQQQQPTFRGRKLGCLVSDGVDGALVQALAQAVQAQGGVLDIVAVQVGGVRTAQGDWIDGDQSLEGGPSVLYDAVVIAVADEAAKRLSHEATARDFVTDAYAHLKYIGFTATAKPLLAAVGVPDSGDEAVIELTAADTASAFVQAAMQLRLWTREARVKQR
jgi:catalase